MRKEFDITRSIEIAVGVDACYEMILDFERYGDWCPFVKGVKILARDEKTGIPYKASFDLKFVIPKIIRLVLNYAYDREKYRLEYSASGGDVENAVGSYQYRPLVNDRTLLVFNVKIDFGIAVPPKISNYLIDKVMNEYLESIRGGCESRSRGL